ncbi:MAG: hypothetical protein A2Z34_07460 [Planctomycetes bacterium RBG_16_59_8]|nr:MAG: hypothetical protein A2Z34_07460 [Planctomycetes bacterium RBG_16_59_8]
MKKGFTLVEMLVVIAVISILMAFLIVLVPWTRIQSEVEKTKALIKKLESGIDRYRNVYRLYPPSLADGSSRALQYCLGAELEETTSYHGGGGTSKKKKPPLLDFDATELKGGNLVFPTTIDEAVPVIDAWGQNITYRNPGIDHRPTGSDNSKYVDIVSAGVDGDLGTAEDNLHNYGQ